MPTDRATFIGGSDVASIMGLSPYENDTPLSVYYNKTQSWPDGPSKPDPARERIFWRGKAMEPIVIKMLKREYAAKVVKQSTPRKPNRYHDLQYPWMAAEIDFEFVVTPSLQRSFPAFEQVPVGELCNGEVKTVHPFGRYQYGEDQSDEVPIHYAAQAMWGLGVSRRNHTLFAVLVGSDNLSVYKVDRDQAVIDEMRARVVRFWFDNVQAERPPDPMRLLDVYRLFKREQPTQIAATQEIAFAARKLREIQESIRVESEAVKELQFQVGAFMLGADVVKEGLDKPAHVLTVDGVPFLRFRRETQNRIDTKLLEIEEPDLVDKYRKQMSFWKCEKAPKPKR